MRGRKCVRGNNSIAMKPSGLEGVSKIERLTYTNREACAVLGVSKVTLWRLEQRGLLRSVAGLRCKLWPVAELRRFVEKGTA